MPLTSLSQRRNGLNFGRSSSISGGPLAPPVVTGLVIDGVGTTAPYGGQNSVLAVNGDKFMAGYRIFIDGVEIVPTNFISKNQLTCTIPPWVTAQPGTYSVVVLTTTGAAASLPMTFDVVVVPYSISGITYWLDPTRYADELYPGAQWDMVAEMSRVISPVGTTPPTMTVTGTPAFTPLNLRVEVTTGGSLGTAVVQYSTDCGETYTTGVTTAASVALPGTGLTLGFAAGSYSVGHKWESDTKVNNVRSRESTSGVVDSTKTLSQITGSRRPGFVRRHPSFGNRPAMRVNGLAADTIYLENTVDWSTPLAVPMTFFIVGNIPGRDPSSTTNYIMFCDTPSFAGIVCAVAGDSSPSDAGKFLTAWQAGGLTVTINNAPSPANQYGKDNPGIICIVADGTNATAYAGGTAFSNVRAGVSWGSSLTRARIFNYVGGNVNTPWESIAELLMFNRVLSISEINVVGSYLASKFLLTWST